MGSTENVRFIRTIGNLDLESASYALTASQIKTVKLSNLSSVARVFDRRTWIAILETRIWSELIDKDYWKVSYSFGGFLKGHLGHALCDRRLAMVGRSSLSSCEGSFTVELQSSNSELVQLDDELTYAKLNCILVSSAKCSKLECVWIRV